MTSSITLAGNITTIAGRNIVEDDDKDEDNALRSAVEMIGYKMEAADDEVGKVHDLIIGDNYEIEYIVVKAHNLICRNYILISPEWINYISYNKKMFSLNKQKAFFEDCAEYKLGDTLSDKYKKVLHEFFGMKK